MKGSNRKLGLLLVIFMSILALAYTLKIASEKRIATPDEHGLNSSDQKNRPDIFDDPCWFKKSVNIVPENIDELNKRRSREASGYPSEQSLSSAVNVFNEEAECVKRFAGLPRLTEEEVIAAIFAGSEPGQDNARQNEVFRGILKTKTLPKGALLWGTSGGCVVNETTGNQGLCPKGRKIILFVDLDRNPRDLDELKSYQSFVIRKNFSGLEVMP